MRAPARALAPLLAALCSVGPARAVLPDDAWAPPEEVALVGEALLGGDGAGAAPQCFEIRVHSDGAPFQCPEYCAYKRFQQRHGMCQAECVPPEGCIHRKSPFTNFANNQTMMCGICLVTGCEACAPGDDDTCERCQKGTYDNGNGQCVSEFSHLWLPVYFSLAAVVLFLLTYVMTLRLRPNVNPIVLEGGLIFRKFSKIRQDTGNNAPYRLFLDLRRRDVAGVGVQLFFDWQFCMLLWSCVVALMLYALAWVFPERPSTVHNPPGDVHNFPACNPKLKEQEDVVNHMMREYTWVVLAVYVLSTLGSLALARFHKNMFRRARESALTMSDFTLLARNLPEDPGLLGSPERLEDDLKEAFERALEGARVVGVSVCWDFRSCSRKVKVEVRTELDRLQKETALAMHGDQCVVYRARSQTMEPTRGGGEVRGCCAPFAYVDYMLGYGSKPRRRMSEDAAAAAAERAEEAGAAGQGQTERILGLLRGLKCSGYAFVVFETPRECEEAFKLLGGGTRMICGRPVRLQKITVEADEVQWDAFGSSRCLRAVRLIMGSFFILFSIAFFDAFFYGPWVHYLTSMQPIKMQKTTCVLCGEYMEPLLLSFLVVVGNQLIYLVCDKVAKGCQFHYRSTYMTYYVIFYTVAVLINTVVDLRTAILSMAGADTKPKYSLRAETLLQDPSLQYRLFQAASSYIKSCLFVPFVHEPLTLYALPYFVHRWLVRSHPTATLQLAEDNLACPEFILTRYGDILINMMLCALALMFTFRELFGLFLGLVLSQLFILSWDHYRLLRASSRTDVASRAMDQTSLYLTALPCAIMAAVLVFRCFLLSGFQEHQALLWPSAGLALAAHLVLHILALGFVQGIFTDDDVEDNSHNNHPYREVAEKIPCTFFNSNPVHCLRSKYVHKHSPPCIPFRAGKEYLLEPNPERSQFYRGDCDSHPVWKWATGRVSLTAATSILNLAASTTADVACDVASGLGSEIRDVAVGIGTELRVFSSST